jgi:hypothetical protein
MILNFIKPSILVNLLGRFRNIRFGRKT